MKKIQPQRLESCYCNTDDTRARPSSEIQAKHYVETVQVTGMLKNMSAYILQNQEILLEESFREDIF